ncbi:MAG: DMT family transporter [Flavobacteriales bacterium]
MSPTLRAHLALSAVALIYGANYVIAKTVMPDPIDPNAFIALRVLGAVILFWLISYRHVTIPERADWLRIILCGMTGVAINQLFFFNGLSLTSPLNSAIIMTSNPIMVMLIAAWILRSPLSSKKITGVILGTAGAVSILLMSSMDKSVHSSALGDTFILINSLSYAFYLVLVKPLMKKYHPLNVITWVFTAGLIMVLPFGGTGLYAVDWGVLTTWQWFAVGYVIVFVTFMTYLLNILALSIVSSTTASAYIYFQPLLAGVFSWLFSMILDSPVHNDFTLLKGVFTLMIFIGVYLVSIADASKAKV